EPRNLNGFGYAHQSPLVMKDADGNSPVSWAAKKLTFKGIKHATRRLMMKQIHRRMYKMRRSGVARRIGERGMEAVDQAFNALEGNWAEFALEMVPYAGDGYTIGKLTRCQFQSNTAPEFQSKSAPVGIRWNAHGPSLA
ncbi:MAG: hypothetical protein P8Y36_10415, partial [Alphaproteobacteria bacterium]